MTDGVDWHDALLAFAALLGEPRDAAGEVAREGDGEVARALRSPDREVRARAVARVAAAVVAELEGAGLR
jgi:hypothetical protein